MSDVRAVEAVNVSKRYEELVAVNGISLDVAQGEVCVLGSHRAGRGDVSANAFGLIRADGGSIRLFGHTRDTDGPRALDGVTGFIECAATAPNVEGLHEHTSS